MKPTYTGADTLLIMTHAKRYNQFLLKEILNASKNHRLAIDFGAGIGTFAKIIKENNVEAYCVETDLHFQEQLRKEGFKTFSSLNEIHEKVDFVYSLNVLEHIYDDLAALKDINRTLNQGGILYLYLPAFNLLFSSFDKKVGHYRRYRMSTLIPLLHKAGFSIEKSYYVDSLGFLVALIFKIFGNNKGVLNPYIIHFYDQVLFPISRILDKIFSPFFGKNIAIIAKKHDPTYSDELKRNINVRYLHQGANPHQ